jgi:hypothetical protein
MSAHNARLPGAARATYEALRAQGFDAPYALRAAGGAVLAASGSDRSAPALVPLSAPVPRTPEGWADFVRALVGGPP